MLAAIDVPMKQVDCAAHGSNGCERAEHVPVRADPR